MPSTPPIPADETDRLIQLRELLVLDSAPEPVFDAIARLASEVCGSPIALLSLVDEERQWFKANVGLPGVSETPRDVAFCAHAVMADSVFQVADAHLDPRFRDNPLVTSAPSIRFYAGAPLVLPGGSRAGALCVIDREARELSDDQTHMLASLAQIASRALVMRRELIDKSLAVRSHYEQLVSTSEAHYRAIVESQSELISLARADGELVFVNPAYARHFGRTSAQMHGSNLFDFIDPADRDMVRQQIDAVLRSGQATSGENRMLAADGSERWVAWTNGVQTDAAGTTLLHSVGRDITDRKRAEEALRASQAFLSRTGRVAGVGGWQVELAHGTITWSEETRRIHEVGPDFVPTLENAIAFYAPQARATISEAVQRATEHGEPWDLELPFITGAGRDIWVRAVGEVEFDGDRPVRLLGAFQDITQRRATEQALRELTAIFDNTTDYVVQTDWRGHIVYMNPAVRRATGLGADESVAHRRFTEFNTPATVQLLAEVIVPAVKAHGVWVGESTVYVAGQREIPVSHMVIAHRDAQGRVERYSAVMRDISAERAAEAQIQRQTDTVRSVTEAIPAMVAVVGVDGCYRFVNTSFERWAGVPRGRIIGRSMQDVLSPERYANRRPWAQRALAGETVSFQEDSSGRHGVTYHALSYIPLRLDGGAIDGFVSVANDITEQKHEEGRLLQLSQRDPLTGLLNRAGFEDELERQLQAGAGPSLALLYIDLDHFKPVNDRHGHAVGDEVLRLFAQRLRKLVRPTDAVARLGGDEFAVLLASVQTPRNAQAVADKVVAMAGAPFGVDELRLTIGASVGIALGADPVTGWHDLMARADATMYVAKAQGRGRPVREGH